MPSRDRMAHVLTFASRGRVFSEYIFFGEAAVELETSALRFTKGGKFPFKLAQLEIILARAGMNLTRSRQYATSPAIERSFGLIC